MRPRPIPRERERKAFFLVAAAAHFLLSSPRKHSLTRLPPPLFPISIISTLSGRGPHRARRARMAGRRRRGARRGRAVVEARRCLLCRSRRRRRFDLDLDLDCSRSRDIEAAAAPGASTPPRRATKPRAADDAAAGRAVGSKRGRGHAPARRPPKAPKGAPTLSPASKTSENASSYAPARRLGRLRADARGLQGRAGPGDGRRGQRDRVERGG